MPSLLMGDCLSDMRISSKTPIDALLDGGLQTGLMTHVYGPAGSGKTTFALHASISTALLEDNVLYFDAEHAFPPNRLLQVTGKRKNDSIFHRITVSQPASFWEQGNQFFELREKGGAPWGLRNLRLVVVDTIARHYRLEAAKRPRGRVFKELAEEQMPALLKAARRFDIAVLVLNQVTSNFSCAEGVEPVGGDAVSRSVKYGIRLETEETLGGVGWATIEKAPKRLQIGKKTRYVITSAGITQPKVPA